MRQCLCSTLINIVGYHCPNQELKAVLAALGGRNQNQGDGCNIVADCCIHIAQKMIAEQISRGCTANIWFKNSSQVKKKNTRDWNHDFFSPCSNYSSVGAMLPMHTATNRMSEARILKQDYELMRHPHEESSEHWHNLHLLPALQMLIPP